MWMQVTLAVPVRAATRSAHNIGFSLKVNPFLGTESKAFTFLFLASIMTNVLHEILDVSMMFWDILQLFPNVPTVPDADAVLWGKYRTIAAYAV